MDILEQELLEIGSDAECLRLWQDHPSYGVVHKWIDRGIADAMSHMTNPSLTDQGTHHWRGVYLGLLDFKTLPERVFQRERDLRGQKENASGR